MKVREDPKAERIERETALGWSKGDSTCTVDSREAVVMKWLLKHPDFTVRFLEHGEQGHVEHVVGTLPIGCLKLRGKARGTSGHAAILGQLQGSTEGRYATPGHPRIASPERVGVSV